MSPDNYSEYKMINCKRIRINFPNALQVSEHDSMDSMRNWLQFSKVDLEKASFSLWDESGLVKVLDDVNIKDINSVTGSITKAWCEYDNFKTKEFH
ncbi:MAG: hypothetical protein ACN2B6_01200 [Rickettsiales bacterium]